MVISEFDRLTDEEKSRLLFNCCGSGLWVEKMLTVFPVEDLVDLIEYADEKWEECGKEDFLEAFSHHPKIGDLSALKEKFAATAAWASNEQSGVNQAPEDILEALAEVNEQYERKFGYIFIVCASRKSADEMLALLKARLGNSPENEIKIAAEEQRKITNIRLEKLFL